MEKINIEMFKIGINFCCVSTCGENILWDKFNAIREAVEELYGTSTFYEHYHAIKQSLEDKKKWIR